MIRLMVSCVLIALLPELASGQVIPKTEVFGGYSYLRGKGASLPSRVDENTDMNGWNVSIVRNLNDWFGLVADFSGHYGGRVSRSQTSAGEFTGRTSKNMHLFLVGPRFSLFKTKRFTPFAHSLFGAAHARTRTEESLAPFPKFRESNSEVAFAAAFGVGLDIRVSEAIALRVVQADYVLTRIASQDFSKDNRDNLRVSTGLSYRFGRVK